MASVSQWTPFGVALDLTATAGTITRTSATQFTVVINASWATHWSTKTDYGMTVSSGGGSKSLNAEGTKSTGSSGSFTGTYSISGNGSATKTITVVFKNYNTYHGDSATKSINLSVSVPAWTSYKITYNANGGSGAPSSQTKWKNQTLTLSSTKPTRTGYSFLGWSTSSTATSATYSAGGSYTANAAATLYAVWKANTYTVSYNANGGSGAPSSQTKTYGKTLTLSSTVPTRTNYTFKGWGTSASATTVAYSAGGSYTSNANITLYAIWSLDYVLPRITGLTVSRCSSTGGILSTGTYAHVSFSWATDREVTSIIVYWKLSTETSYTNSKTISASGTGSQAGIIVNGFSSEYVYDFQVVVSDSGGSSSWTVVLPSAFFMIDFSGDGTGVAIGGASSISNTVDVHKTSLFRDDITVTNGHNLYFQNTSGASRQVIGLNPYNQIVVGGGSYDNSEGDVFYTGNKTYLDSRSSVYLSSGSSGLSFAPLGENLVLWSGGYYMTAGHSITLSSPISKQVHGIVLVWSQYTGSSSTNANFVYHFIPKQHIKSFAGGGVDIHLSNSAFTEIASKYLYVNDTTITGHDNNNKTGTSDGVTFNNGFWVLRQVIGV